MLKPKSAALVSGSDKLKKAIIPKMNTFLLMGGSPSVIVFRPDDLANWWN